MSKLLGCGLLAVGLCAQVQEIRFESPPPPSVSPTTISAQVTGTRGNQEIFYWVVANYPIGNAFPGGPAQIRDAPGLLNGTNFVTVRWSGVEGALTYDLLKTATPGAPQGVCNCAVATGIVGTSQVDNSQTTLAYTISSASSVTSVVRLDNRDFAQPRFRFGSDFNNVTVRGRFDAGSGARTTPNRLGAGVPAGVCTSGETFQRTDAGEIYSCVNQAWILTGGGGGGYSTFKDDGVAEIQRNTADFQDGFVLGDDGVETEIDVDPNYVAILGNNNPLVGNNQVNVQYVSTIENNDTAVGTTLNNLAKLQSDGAGGLEVVIADTADTEAPLGICGSGCGNSGQATIILQGTFECDFEGAATLGNWAIMSTTVDGECSDSGAATEPTSGIVVGIIRETIGGAGLADVEITEKGVFKASGSIPFVHNVEFAIREAAVSNEGNVNSDTGSDDLSAAGMNLAGQRFSTGVDSRLNFELFVPDAWDGGTVTVRIIYANGPGSGDVAWQLDTGCLADTDATGAPAFNAADSYVETVAANQYNFSVRTPAVTNCAANEFMFVRLQRLGTSGSDTYGATVRPIAGSVHMLLNP